MSILKKISYKSTTLIISDHLSNFDNIIRIISENTKSRIINNKNISEAYESNKRKRIDTILLSQTLFNKSTSKSALLDLRKLAKIHSSAVFLVFFKSKFTDRTNLDKYFDIVPNFIPIIEPLNEKQFLLNLLNANHFGKINNENKSNSLRLRNLINENRKILSRLEEFVVKENERASLYNENKDYSINTRNAESVINENFIATTKYPKEREDEENNDGILESLSQLFKKLNKINKVEDISLELEEKIPNILNINKFSIFLIGKEFKDLKHFSSSNFNGKKSNRLSIEQIFEKSVMFDTIFKREVIYLKNYKNSKFSIIPEKDNEFIKYSNTDSLCTPLMSGNKIIGVANFNDSKLGSFSKNQLNHISMFANFVAILLDNILPQIEKKDKLESELDD